MSKTQVSRLHNWLCFLSPGVPRKGDQAARRGGSDKGDVLAPCAAPGTPPPRLTLRVSAPPRRCHTRCAGFEQQAALTFLQRTPREASSQGGDGTVEGKGQDGNVAGKTAPGDQLSRLHWVSVPGLRPP